MRLLLKRSIIPLAKIDSVLPKSGKIVDLGCGEGLVSLELAKRRKRQLIGIDQNAHKITQALSARKNALNTSFTVGDICGQLPKLISGCVISDVLHHLPRSSQMPLIKKVYSHLKPGGVLVIKEINSQDMLRSKLSRLWDYVFYPQDKINYLSSASLVDNMRKIGFKVKHQRACKLVPASIHLYIGIKP